MTTGRRPPVPGGEPALRAALAPPDDQPRVQGLGTIFPNAACVTALVDRLTHHAEIITIAGESYRRREAEAAQKARRVKP